MLIVNRVGEHAAAYYVAEAGQWWGGGIDGIGVEGGVQPAALRAVLRGEAPGTGVRLQARQVAHRRAGWDLIFATPKSISLLAALGSEPTATTLGDAHRRAVDDTLRWFEAHGCWARRHGALASTDGIIAARYDHTTSSAGDPHLHTHVLVANLVRSGGEWSALDGSGLWLQQRALAAAYHLGLRNHIREGGLSFDWNLAADGTFDVAGIPRTVVDAASSRRVAINAAVGPGQHPGSAGETARRRLRLEPVGPWPQRVSAAGFSGADADRIINQGHANAWSERAEAARLKPQPQQLHAVGTEHGATTDHAVTTDRAITTDRAVATDRAATTDRALVASVVTHLAERRSSFSVNDVMAALAANHPGGTTASAAGRWSEALCASSLPTADGHWTTPYARAIDDRLRQIAVARTGRNTTSLSDHAADRLMAERPDVSPELADAVRRLATCHDGVIVVGSPLRAARLPAADAWVAQAALLEAAGHVWKAAGLTVEVEAGSNVAASRWRALTGLTTRTSTQDRQGEPSSVSAPRPPDVLIVDRADRATAGALTGLLTAAERTATTVVLVEGGTLPARRRALSEGLEEIVADHGKVEALGRPAVVDHVAAAWSRSGPPAERPLLVGLGPTECHVLNALARQYLRTEGVLSGDEVAVGPRSYAVGDRVMALRRPAGPAGRTGHVEAVDPRRGTMEVTWSDGLHQRVDRRLGPSVGHAYATTPAMLRLTAGPVVVLGARDDLGRHAHRAVAALTTERFGPARAAEPLYQSIATAEMTPAGVARAARPAGQRQEHGQRAVSVDRSPSTDASGHEVATREPASHRRRPPDIGLGL